MVEVDLTSPAVVVETARAKDAVRGRERTSAIAQRLRRAGVQVVAALNGDAFDLETGESLNNHISRGIVVRAVGGARLLPQFLDIPNSQFALTADGKPLLEQFRFSGSVVARDGMALKIDAVNTLRRGSPLLLFNKYFGASTPVRQNAAEVTLARLASLKDTLLCVVSRGPTAGGATAIADSGMVVAGYGGAAAAFVSRLSLGDTVRVMLAMDPNHGPLKELIGGWPRLVRNGVSVFEDPAFPENPSASAFTRRHPRTGIGFSSDSTVLYLLTVDGRQRKSVGMSHHEFARLMITLGIHDGLNLDGGGSTTLYVNGRVVTSASDPFGERPVGNCILVVRKRPDL